ncbi:MAG TPA: helical backbone metal receptor [Gemmatimonadales bacterium]|jgi:iron complex transport system substrate-binding protein|nr:helical backbone metal receptor [Gemmatimonadales bacterium]
MRGVKHSWLAGAVFLAACAGGRKPSHPTITVTDDVGRTVSLAAPAHRIVSLAPSSTELLFAVGAGPEVVGRTTWCRYPAAALAVPVVGDGLDPNIESVAATHPDLVVLYRSPSNAAALAQLERLSIPAAVLRQDRLGDVARDARLLGTLTGHVAAGDSIARALDSLTASPPPAPRIRIAFVVWDNPPIVIGAGSFLDELGRRAGAENVFHDLSQASAPVSLESIASRNPDVIAVVDDSSAATAPAFARRPEWKVVRAVGAGRIIHLPGDLFGRPTPRAAEAIAVFARLLGGPR